jgi:hypothetical protein
MAKNIANGMDVERRVFIFNLLYSKGHTPNQPRMNQTSLLYQQLPDVYNSVLLNFCQVNTDIQFQILPSGGCFSIVLDSLCVKRYSNAASLFAVFPG